MARPLVPPTQFASSSTYLVGSGVPAGLIGSNVRVSGPASFYQFGIVPGQTLKSQWFNHVIGVNTDWLLWLYSGTSTMTKTDHPVETDSSGIARLWGLRLGDGSATGLNATQKLTIIGDGTQRAVDITTATTSLQALFIDHVSDFAQAIRVEVSGAGGAMYLDGSGATEPALQVVATTETAVDSESQEIGVQGTSTGGLGEAGVKGIGVNIGVKGEASGTGGSGGSFTTAPSATSSAEGVRGIGLGDAPGGRFSGEDGSAVIGSCTGEEDVFVALATGTGAAARLDPQDQPAVQRLGQFHVESFDTDRGTPKFCSNATGLALVDKYFWGGQAPLLRAFEWSAAVVQVAQNVTNSVLIDLAIENPYGFTVAVMIRGEFSSVPNPIGAIALPATITTTLHDSTAAATIETDAYTIHAGTQRNRHSMRAQYSLPAATTTTIQFRASVPAGAGGAVDFSHLSLSIETANGAFT
jgi:hypothetical protein